MILVFGGTTEGRKAVSVLDDGEGSYFYSTRGDAQDVVCLHGKHICGEMTASDISEFCRTHGIRLIIDAAHPFASNLHASIGRVSEELMLPVIRFERRYTNPYPENVIWCDDYHDAMKKMERDGVRSLVALTGVQTIPRLRDFWEKYPVWFRILDRDESREKASDYGFPASRLIYYRDKSSSLTMQMLMQTSPDAILTKESGDTGGFVEKVNAAVNAGVKVYAVRRPLLPKNFKTVEGPHGLRMLIERLIPEFYRLHTGFTTGSCATAATAAAARALLSQNSVSEVVFSLPDGERMTMPVCDVHISRDRAFASVIKYAGDDPDVTDKCRITAEVSFASHGKICFKQGHGVGIVTLPGLGIEVGEPAINPTPRSMIERELRKLYAGGIDVTISVDGGEELALRTFNPKVGVKGGISIVGTTGIVRPFSHEAFVESMCREMEVAKAMKCERIVVNSGARSERYLRQLYPDLPPQAFIHYGNAIGDMMRIAERLVVKRLTIGLMLGKAVKLAEGNFDTHSHKVTLNKEFLKRFARECGCSPEAISVIDDITLARELWNSLRPDDSGIFFRNLIILCHRYCSELFHGELEAVLITDDGEIAIRYNGQ